MHIFLLIAVIIGLGQALALKSAGEVVLPKSPDQDLADPLQLIRAGFVTVGYLVILPFQEQTGTGYMWRLRSDYPDGNVVLFLGERSSGTANMPGSIGWRKFSFLVTCMGQTTLNFDLLDPSLSLSCSQSFLVTADQRGVLVQRTR
ncbi:hypothetical protein PAPYR_358 [Paratrimastix pyriformis]|uniref:Uncharacterized protein n=1 Tax=Paratrimastix pyriformis TaxID=342808 RepID=A0ABQ8V214_9EUKA|nr:hypothetical protein PAPYR_358 [Paratrimastix pyriformis]